jgi:hypothetical protein
MGIIDMFNSGIRVKAAITFIPRGIGVFLY